MIKIRRMYAPSLTCIYNTEPVYREILGRTIIQPVLGVNPIDVSEVILKNVRGQTQYTIISGDNGYISTFQVTGGLGIASLTDGFYFVERTNMGCTVSTPVQNTLRITTDVADAGGRTYELVLYPYNSLPPKIQKIAGANIGNFNVIVDVKKTSIAWS